MRGKRALSPYRQGVLLEKQGRADLEHAGWFVVESRGSHGFADLVAIRFHAGLSTAGWRVAEALLVQAKTSGTGKISKSARSTLFKQADDHGARAVLLSRPRRGVRLYQGMDVDGHLVGSVEVTNRTLDMARKI